MTRSRTIPEKLRRPAASRRPWIAALLALLAAPSSAEARAEGDILLHSASGKPSPSATRYLNYVVRALGDDAPRHGSELTEAIDRKLSRDAGSADRSKELLGPVKRGRNAFLNGEYGKAIEQLTAARHQLLAHVALLANDQSVRKKLYEALLYLAHAHLRHQNRTRAVAVMGDVVRSFPGRQPSSLRFAPDLLELFRTVQRDLAAEQRGKLTVSTDPPGCLVFINERYVGVSPRTVEDLPPGGYRVFVQRPGQPGRVHAVQINGGASAKLDIDFTLDRALETRPVVGLRFSDEAARRQHEIRFAAEVGRRLGAENVLLLGAQRYQGRRALRGTVIAASTGRIVRSGMLALEPSEPSPDELHALGRFLVAGERGAGVIVRAPGPETAAGGQERDEDNDSSGFFSARLWRWITLGVGLAAVGGGIPLLVLHGKGTCDQQRCPEKYNTLAPGLALTIGGGAALVTSAVLFILAARTPAHESREPQSAVVAPFVAPGGGGAAALLRF